jgi:hypothetical protein
MLEKFLKMHAIVRLGRVLIELPCALTVNLGVSSLLSSFMRVDLAMGKF